MSKKQTSKGKEVAVIDRIETVFKENGTVPKIAGDDDMVLATKSLSLFNTALKELTTEKEKLTKPLNAALKEIRARYKPAEDKLGGFIEKIRDSMSDYQTAETKRADEEAAKIAARVGDGRGKLGVETAARKLGEIAVPVKAIGTNAGAVHFRTDKVLKITDIDKIRGFAARTGNWSFFELDESTLLTALKNGQAVPGAEIETKQVPVNTL